MSEIASHSQCESHPARWSFASGDVRILFLGRTATADIERSEALQSVVPEAPRVAWAKQVHGDRLLVGRDGFCGEGDAIGTDRKNLAVSVITADCVPILIASRDRVTAVHAGWRGLVQGVIAASVRNLTGPIQAWIGPSIGPCCYEVDEDVAAKVVASAGAHVETRPTVKPHLDLAAVARYQLREQGVEQIKTVTKCTQCHSAALWSYRREGPGAGRNISYIWRL